MGRVVAIVPAVTIGNIFKRACRMHFPFINDKYACLLIFLFSVGRVAGHEHSLSQHKLTRLIALAQAARLAEDQQQVAQNRPNCQLSIDLIDAQTKQPLAGMVRITHLDSGKALHWDHEIHRNQNWYALPACTTLKVPRTILTIEAFHGLETETRVIEVDVTTKRKFTLQVALKRFYQSGRLHLPNKKVPPSLYSHNDMLEKKMDDFADWK